MRSRPHLNAATRAILGAIAILALLLLSSAAAQAKPAYVARSLASDANGTRLLWSSCCSLYTRYDGVTSRLPIASFGLPEDAQQASLGTGPDGEQVAAYDRCGPSLHNCALYIYNFATGVEERLPVSSHGGAFMTPSVSGDRIAYAYNPGGRDGPNRTFGIYWSYLNGTHMYRVHTEPMDAIRTQPQLALSGTHLAYAGASNLTSCLDQTHVRIATLGTDRDVLVATGTSRTDVFSPNWSGDVLYYARDEFMVASYRHDLTRHQIERSRVERYSLATGKTSASPYTSQAVTEVEPDGPGLLFFQLVTGNWRTTGLYDAGALTFSRIKPHRKLARV